MKLVHIHDYSARNQYSIAEAVSKSFDGSNYGQGVLEDAQKTADNAVSAIAKLVELLHSKGVLTDGDVLSLLSRSYEIVRENAP